MRKNKFDELGIEPKVAVEVRFNDDARAMIEHGLGVGFLYDYAVSERKTAELKIIPLTDELRLVPIYLLRHRRHAQNSFIRQFYDVVAAELERFGSSDMAY